MSGRKLVAILLAGGGAIVLAPTVWVLFVAVGGGVGAALNLPAAGLGGGTLCGMFGAFATALGCGLVARGLLRVG